MKMRVKFTIGDVRLYGDRYHVDRVVTVYFNDFPQGRVALVYTYKGKQWINSINLKTNLTVSELNTFS